MASVDRRTGGGSSPPGVEPANGVAHRPQNGHWSRIVGCVFGPTCCALSLLPICCPNPGAGRPWARHKVRSRGACGLGGGGAWTRLAWVRLHKIPSWKSSLGYPVARFGYEDFRVVPSIRLMPSRTMYAPSSPGCGWPWSMRVIPPGPPQEPSGWAVATARGRASWCA